MISHTMKFWERIIDRRLRKETSIGEVQFAFMPGRGTTDAIFAARQVIEKHREMQKELHLVFIDLEMVYDRVPRQEVWRCLREQGVSEKYVRLVKDTYEDARRPDDIVMCSSRSVGSGCKTSRLPCRGGVFAANVVCRQHYTGCVDNME